MLRKFFMLLSWYIKEFGDWMHDKALGYETYKGPYYCDHCHRWNFQEKGDK